MDSDPSDKDAYREFFDVIRPRSESPEWMLWAFLGFAVALVALVWGGAILKRRREERYRRHMFRMLSEEKGLNDGEEQMLWHMATRCKFRNPLIILSSIPAFDQGVERELDDISGEDETQRKEEMDRRLRALRRKLRFDERPLGWALRHTREISAGQRLLLGFKRGDHTRFCSCAVVEVGSRGLTVTPIVRADEDALRDVAPEETLYARFWRQGDTEYKFRSCLHPDTDPERETLLLAHTDQLERVQRRDFFRLRVNIPMALYALPDEEAAERPPKAVLVEDSERPRLEGTLIDLSAGGVSLHSRTGVAKGELLVIDPGFEGQFSLAGVVCRVVRSDDGAEKGYMHHLEYVNVDETLQDRLVQQIYRRQIELAQA